MQKYRQHAERRPQHDTAGTQFTHLPATLDNRSAVIRAMTERFPMDTLRAFPRDFASSFRQATADLEQAHLCALATWDHSNQCVVFGLAVAQLFGDKSAGLNFCRVPAWCCWAMAYLHGCCYHHCVDDMLTEEKVSNAESSVCAWRQLAALRMGGSLDLQPKYLAS